MVIILFQGISTSNKYDVRHHAKLKPTHPVCKNATAGYNARPQQVNTEFYFDVQSKLTPSLQLDRLLLSFPVVALQLIRSILGNIFNEVIQFPTSVIRNWLFRILRQPEECWEALDIEFWGNVIGCSIHLDNFHIFLSHFLTQFIIDGGEFLAVSAPWSVELDQHVFLALCDQLLEIFSNCDLHSSSRVVWHRFRLDPGLHVSSLKLSQEFLEGCHIKLRGHLVLQALSIPGSHDRLVPGSSVESEFAKLAHKVVVVANGKVESVVLLPNLEDPVPPVVGALGVLGVVNRVVGSHEWHLEILSIVCSSVSAKSINVVTYPGSKSSLVGVGARVDDCRVFELALKMLRPEHDNTLLVSKLGHDLLSTGVGKCVLLSQFCSSLGKCLLDGGICSSESKDNCISLPKNSFSLCYCLDLLRSRSNLALHILGDPSSLSRSIIVRTEFSIPEDLEGWVASHLKSATGILTSFSTINLHQAYRWVIC